MCWPPFFFRWSDTVGSSWTAEATKSCKIAYGLRWASKSKESVLGYRRSPRVLVRADCVRWLLRARDRHDDGISECGLCDCELGSHRRSRSFKEAGFEEWSPLCSVDIEEVEGAVKSEAKLVMGAAEGLPLRPSRRRIGTRSSGGAFSSAGTSLRRACTVGYGGGEPCHAGNDASSNYRLSGHEITIGICMIFSWMTGKRSTFVWLILKCVYDSFLIRFASSILPLVFVLL